MELTKKNISAEFLKLRLKHDKTQSEIHEATKLSRTTLSRIETGKADGKPVRAETIFKLNEYFEKLGE